MRFSLYMQVENLFDWLNERRVFNSTGSSLTSLAEVTNPTLFDNLTEAIEANPDNFFPIRFIKDFYQREDFLGPPREIRWGLSFQF